MSEHLSSDQIADYVAGIAPAEMAQHLRQCAGCEAEVERLNESLQMFRLVVRETAGSLSERQIVLGMPKRRVAVLWATAAAALVTLAVIPVYQVQQNQRKAEIARQDAELMEHVNADLSEGVASPMKPLEKMVSWGPDAKKASEKRND